jgi:hypothetical protein
MFAVYSIWFKLKTPPSALATGILWMVLNGPESCYLEGLKQTSKRTPWINSQTAWCTTWSQVPKCSCLRDFKGRLVMIFPDFLNLLLSQPIL